MASLDLAREFLQTHSAEYAAAVRETARLRRKYDGKNGLRALTGADAPLDPLRLTVSCPDGRTLSDTLYESHGVACEMADRFNLVFIVTPADLPANLARLEAALDACAPNAPLAPPVFAVPPAPGARLPGAAGAVVPRKGAVPLREAAGQVCARPVTPYPPGIPLLWPGEEIPVKHIEFLTDRCYNTVSEVFICTNLPRRRESQ